MGAVGYYAHDLPNERCQFWKETKLTSGNDLIHEKIEELCHRYRDKDDHPRAGQNGWERCRRDPWKLTRTASASDQQPEEDLGSTLVGSDWILF